MSKVLKSSLRWLGDLRACPALCAPLRLEVLDAPEPCHIHGKPAYRLARAGSDTFIRMARRPWHILRVDSAGVITERWSTASQWIHSLGQAAIVAWKNDLALVAAAPTAELCVDVANRAVPAERLSFSDLGDPRRLFAWALAMRDDNHDPEQMRAVSVPQGDPDEAARFCLAELADLVGADLEDDERDQDTPADPAWVVAQIVAAAPQLANEQLQEWVLIGRDLNERSLWWDPSVLPAYRPSRPGFRVVELDGGKVLGSWTTPEGFLAELLLPRLVATRVHYVQAFLLGRPLSPSRGEKVVFALLASPFVALGALAGGAVLATVVLVVGLVVDSLIVPIPAPSAFGLISAGMAAALLGILIPIGYLVAGPD
jgi:hypothetical protein